MVECPNVSTTNSNLQKSIDLVFNQWRRTSIHRPSVKISVNSFSLDEIFSLFYLSPSSAISVIGSTDPWGNCGADPTNIIVFFEIIRRIADTFTLNIITGYRLMEFRSAGSPPPQKKIGIAVDKPIVFGKILDFIPFSSKFTHLKCWRGKILSNYYETSG